MSTGPLDGIKIIELPNIGPMQFAGMVLSDLGAEVLRLDRASAVEAGVSFMEPKPYAVIDRGRRSAGVDLKHPDGVATVLRLCERADVFLEGFRPGVAERLGVGPNNCRGVNPRLVYGRMTGWGQSGPLAGDPGHDINYLSIAGVLYHLGPAGGPPHPPINLLADFGGGGMLLALGVVSALLERERSGEGQVVDAAMVDGSALIMSIYYGLDAMGMWSERGTNMPDGGAHFYQVYETADGEWVTVASYEPQFYAELLRVLELDDLDPADQWDPEPWPALKRRFAEIFRTKTRAEWVEIFSGHEVCFAPVLSMQEARGHPHNLARDVFVDVDGAPHPAPAPRFGRTPGVVARAPVAPGTDTDTALADWGLSSEEIAALKADGAIA